MAESNQETAAASSGGGFCGCFARGNASSTGAVANNNNSGSRSRSAPTDNNNNNKPVERATQVFHDSMAMGSTGSHHHSVQVEKGDMELAFFDAVEDPLAEDDYPIITTSYVAKQPKKVSFSDPETMLRDSRRGSMDEWHSARFEDARVDPSEGGDLEHDGTLKDGAVVVATTAATAPSPPPPPPAKDGTSPKRSPRASKRAVSKIFRRGSVAVKEDMVAPRVEVQERGYPGQLTAEELLQSQMFYREIHQRKGNYLEIVYALRGIEEEAYSICRFMRATKFDSSKMLERIETNEYQWDEAKAHSFYKDMETALEAPLLLFLQHYPYFYHGNAKNGCPVNYFKAGQLETEALLALCPVEASEKYFWHTFYYTFKDKMVKAKELNPDFVRCESINVMDLAGMTSSQLTSEAMDCLKAVSKIADFFPETLHCMVILNAPGWFAFAWKVIKGFIDPRTARKIQVYSNADKGKQRLAELVDKPEIPSDFGGTSPSLSDVMLEKYREQHPGDTRRMDSMIFYVKKTHAEKKDLATLKAGEISKIMVYTRSITGATVSVTCGGKSVAKDVEVKRPDGSMYASTLGAEEKARPYKTDIVEGIKGPGKIVVEVKGNGESHNSKKLSSGYFLVAIEVDDEKK